MIKAKLWLYDSTAPDYKGTELSKYLLIGTQNTENLTEEMDVTELTLQGYPVREEFAPETKFIVEIHDKTGAREIYHRIVQEDVVEQPSMADDTYFVHQITLTEPSAIAQKRIVDNIAITYKLKDVSLEEAPIFDKDATSELDVVIDPPNPPELTTFGFDMVEYDDGTEASNVTTTCTYAKYFDWKKPSGDQSLIDKVSVYYRNLDGEYVDTDAKFINRANIKEDYNGDKKIRFRLPVPHIMFAKEGTNTYEDIGVANVRVDIVKTDISGNVTNYHREYLSNNYLSSSAAFPYINFNPTFLNGYLEEIFTGQFLAEKTVVSRYGTGGSSYAIYDIYFTDYTDLYNGTNIKDSIIATDDFIVNAGDEFEIMLTVLSKRITASDKISFPQIPFNRTEVNAYDYTASGIADYYRSFCKTITTVPIYVGGTPTVTNVTTSYDNLPQKNWQPTQSYNIGEAETVLESGEQYTALNLVKRAIIASDVYFKESDHASVVDLDDENAPYPFYISNETENDDIVTANDLATIRVNEAFYHQKNLWEILIEAGKYAHAIPQIHFGDDDKFVISFYKLGTTNKKQDENTKISVMNYKKIDDYVSACSSYVENLVQLGGIITEKVAPKSSSEQYIVDNNDAEIIVSKPILEILSIEATITKTYTLAQDGVDIAAGTKAYISPPENLMQSLPNFIYEKFVYDVLPITANVYPNKGVAMYYELGDNIIKGGDYQLPTPTTNPYSDYAFKKILYCAFKQTYPSDLGGLSVSGPWEKIKVNDFIFDVTYRTKDNARVEHTRPDLRHYLLASKHDAVPTHRQFNNQQDILVDSISFGDSMFGKLIRTGNSNYKKREWCIDFSKVKHKGELYDIGGEWYYVARVTNIFFSDHIESVVEFSKDYNQLSEIIGIPSEPRFYEISERSIIDREIAINDYLLVTTNSNNIKTSDGLIYDLSHTKDLVFGNGGAFLKWARSTLKGDENMTAGQEKTFGEKEFEMSVLSPISAYSCGNTLTYEWDMVDNFSAGDAVDLTDISKGSDINSAYRTLKPVQYCDRYGKGTLLDFDLYEDIDFSAYDPQNNIGDTVRNLPNCPENFNESPVISTQLSKGKSAVIIKDCRETLHYNYNLMQITDSDTFVVSPYFFTEKSNGAKIVLLSEEVNKMSNGLIKTSAIIAENAAPTITASANYITVDMGWIENVASENRARAKAIVIMEKDQTGDTQKFLLAKNGTISTNNWYFGEPKKSTFFTRKQ